MDYRLRHNKAELDGTCYIEIGPGRYTRSHWQEGFIFIRDDAFGVAEGIVQKHFPNYAHWGINDISKEDAMKIISEWKTVADRLPSLDRADIQRNINLTAPHFTALESEIESHRLEVSSFLRSLANECENFIHQNDWMCILGI